MLHCIVPLYTGLVLALFKDELGAFIHSDDQGFLTGSFHLLDTVLLFLENLLGLHDLTARVFHQEVLDRVVCIDRVLAGDEASLILVVPRGLALSHSLEVASNIRHVAWILVGVRHRLSVALALLLVLLVHKNELSHIRINLRHVKRLMTLLVATISFCVKNVLFGRVEVVRERVRDLAALCNGNVGSVRRCRSFD